MMTNSDAEVRRTIDATAIIAAIQGQVSPDLALRVTADSHLHQDLGLTSFDYMQLLDELDPDSNAEFDFDLAMKANTVQDLVNALAASDAASQHPTEDGG